MLKIKERIRQAVYGCFPEVDPEAEARSWVNLVLQQLSFIRSDLSSLTFLMSRPPEVQRRCTVVLLPPQNYEGPRFSSQTVIAKEGVEMTVPIETFWPLPAGGWIVAHGCTLSGVFIGNKSQTQAPGAEFCQLSDDVELGVQIRVRVRFEDAIP